MVKVVTVLACCLSRSPQRVSRSHAVGFTQPRRGVTLAMQHTPDVDVVWMLDIEHEVRKTRQRPYAQSRQVEFMRVTRRGCGQMLTDVAVGLLQRIDEAERDGFTCLTQVIGHRFVHIPLGLLTRDDRLAPHALAAGLAALRTRSRKPLK